MGKMIQSEKKRKASEDIIDLDEDEDDFLNESIFSMPLKKEGSIVMKNERGEEVVKTLKKTSQPKMKKITVRVKKEPKYTKKQMLNNRCKPLQDFDWVTEFREALGISQDNLAFIVAKRFRLSANNIFSQALEEARVSHLAEMITQDLSFLDEPDANPSILDEYTDEEREVPDLDSIKDSDVEEEIVVRKKVKKPTTTTTTTASSTSMSVPANPNNNNNNSSSSTGKKPRRSIKGLDEEEVQKMFENGELEMDEEEQEADEKERIEREINRSSYLDSSNKTGYIYKRHHLVHNQTGVEIEAEAERKWYQSASLVDGLSAIDLDAAWYIPLTVRTGNTFNLIDSNTMNNEKVYFQRPLSNDSGNILEAISIQRDIVVGHVMLNHDKLYQSLVAMTRLKYIKMKGSIIFHSYSTHTITCFAEIEFYLAWPSHIIRHMDRISPPPNSLEDDSGRIRELCQLLEMLLGPGIVFGSNRVSDMKQDPKSPKELNENDFVKKNLLTAEAHPNLKATLKQHQKEGLWWMLKREHNPFVSYNTAMNHYWKVYETKFKVMLYYNSYCDKISLDPPKNDRKISGGLLCDEMGLGKTVMSIALILSNHPVISPHPQHSTIFQEIKGGLKDRRKKKMKLALPKTTLVICNTPLVQQWSQEIERHIHSTHKLKVLVYHGPRRHKDLALMDFNSYDVIITTHFTVGLEYKQHKETHGEYPAPLSKMYFWRIIIDESQVCKSKSLLFAAIQNMDSVNKWCLSGTPVQNYLEEMFPPLHFLEVYPIALSIKHWRFLVEKPKNILLLKQALNPILLRRSKKDVPDLELPAKRKTICYLEFNSQEASFYQSIFEQSADYFNYLVQRGLADKNYAAILVLLLRLKQVCGHKALIAASGKVVKNEMLCGFCGDIASEAIINDECNHRYCQECVESHLENFLAEKKPPICPDKNCECIINVLNCDDLHFSDKETKIYKELIKKYILMKNEKISNPNNNVNSVSGPTKMIKNDRNEMIDINQLNKDGHIHFDEHGRAELPEVKVDDQIIPSTKLHAMIVLTQSMLEANEDDKIVIFSQWTSMLDIIEANFKKCDWELHKDYVRFDGKMQHNARNKSLNLFNAKTGARVMLISLKCGGVGLNLTRGNKVILMDPWWNEAAEDQAIGRVHRMGQTKEVDVYKFIVKKTIEERVLELQDVKNQILEAIFSDDYDPTKPFKQYRLSMEQIKSLFQGFETSSSFSSSQPTFSQSSLSQSSSQSTSTSTPPSRSSPTKSSPTNNHVQPVNNTKTLHPLNDPLLQSHQFILSQLLKLREQFIKMGNHQLVKQNEDYLSVIQTRIKHLTNGKVN